MTKDERRIPVLLAKLADLYQVKANRVRQEKGAAHLHTRRLERIVFEVVRRPQGRGISGSGPSNEAQKPESARYRGGGVHGVR